MNDLMNRFPIKLLAFALILALAAALLPSPALAVEEPEITSAAAIVIDLDADKVLYSKNETERRVPASMVKIMTLMLAIEEYERGTVALTDTVVVGSDVYFDIASDGSTLGLQAGEELTFEQLLYCAFLASANEGCNALAEFIAGDVSAFVERMNDRAIELGCTDTHFVNTHGMPAAGQYSTAKDLAVITRAALKLALFKRVAATATYTIPATNMSDERVLETSNGLISSGSMYYYEPATGVKTGYTDEAGFCLVATAARDGRQLLSVVLGGQSQIAEDGRTVTTNFTDTRALFSWAFSNFSYQELLPTVKPIAEIPVKLGLGTSSVVLWPEKNVEALLPNDADLKLVELKPIIYDEGPLTAPVLQGTILGELSVSFEGVDYGTVNLVAKNTVELDRTAYIGAEIRETLHNKYVRIGITVIVILLILYAAFIVYYNFRRMAKRRRAASLARERIEQYRESQGAPPADTPPVRETTIGKSFEEIEAYHRRRDEENSKIPRR